MKTVTPRPQRSLIVAAVVAAIGVVALLVLLRADPEARARPHEHATSSPRAHGTLAGPSPALVTSPIVAGALRLEGQAIDEHEQPIAGATITLGGARTTISEADGSFAFDGLAEGSYDLTGELAELYGETADESLSDASDPIMLKLQSGPTLAVRVIDAAGGQPVANATVEADAREKLTDGDGRVTIRAVEVGRQWVEVSAVGYARQRLLIEIGDLPPPRIERTIVLAAGTSVEGVVVDERGAPVGEARVRLEGPGGAWSQSVDADESGRWKFELVGPGKHVINASGAAHIETPDQIVDLDGVTPRQGVVVRVALGARISGVVVDPAGKPVGEVTVRGGHQRDETDARGRFVLRGLEPGTHELSAETELGAAKPITVTVADAQAQAHVRLVLQTSSVAGIVRDTHGAPVEDARVTVRDKVTEQAVFALTDETGRFDTGGVPLGDYDIFVERNDEPSRDERRVMTVRSPARTLALVVPEIATITGRVLLAGHPVPYYGVIVTADAASWSGAPVAVKARDGRFTRSDVTPGTWAVVIGGPGFAKQVLEGVRVTNGNVDLGDIVVDPGRTLTGRVVDDRGAPIAGAAVAVGGTRFADWTLAAQFGGASHARTDADGRYRMAGVARDGVQRAQATYATGLSREVEVGEAVTTLDFVITTSGSIAGTIERMTTRQYAVIASSIADDDESYRGEVDGAGDFSIGPLPPGDYELTVAGRNALAPIRVTVRPAAQSRARFAMPAHPITLVVDAPGCSIVSLRANADRSLAVEMCEQGRAELPNVEPGHYQLCQRGGCTPIDVAAMPARQEVRFGAVTDE